MASSATTALRKTANALSAEGELLNLYAELKDVLRAFETYLKAIEVTVKSTKNWMDRKGEDTAVHDLLSRIGEVDMEIIEVERRYNDQFRLFAKLWKGILAEKKDLNAKIATLKKAKANTDAARKKIVKADDKEKLDKSKQGLEEAIQQEAEAQKAVDQKLLETQQDKHLTFRQGYTSLYTATMTRLKELVEHQDKIRVMINQFPRVVDRKDDGSFTFAPFEEAGTDKPLWCQGEEFHKELTQANSKYEKAIQQLRDEHTAKLHKLTQEQELNDQQRHMSFTTETRDVIKRHQQAVAEMEANHAAQLEAARRQLDSMTEQYEQAVHSATVAKADLLKQIEKTNKDLLERIAEESRLEEELENKRRDVIVRSVHHAEESVKRVVNTAEIVPATVCLDRAADIKRCAAILKPLLNSDANEFTLEDAVFDLSAAVTDTILSGVGACRCSRAENGNELIPLLRGLEPKVLAVLASKGLRPKALGAAEEEAEAPPPPVVEPPKPAEPSDKPPMFRALYDHAAKVQQGFNLVGFRKGDVVRVIKKRDDGWSKVQNGSEEGWAPTSYLSAEPVAPEPEPAKPQPAAAAAVSAPVNSATAFADLDAHVDAIMAFVKAMIVRDKQLMALQNVAAGDLTSKLSVAQQALQDTRARFEELKKTSEATDRDRYLEVNQKLLTLARKMVDHYVEVVNRAEGIRTILYDTKGSQSDDEFNMRHSSWLKSLSDSVDAIAEGCPMLTESTRSVVTKKGKYEELQVATRNISASVAQLVALTKTKQMGKGKGEEDQKGLITNGDSAISTSHEFLAAGREVQDLLLANILMENFERLTENEAKRLVMATQVNVLKLEKDLDAEREKLGRLRRLNYEDRRT
eukprot:m.152797 g.152797  ORF g.152797 m.152797 type:complete len:862 (+) comp16923_c0_seq3:77-2662(+)